MDTRPFEIFQSILGFLDFRSLSRLSQVTHAAQSISKHSLTPSSSDWSV